METLWLKVAEWFARIAHISLSKHIRFVSLKFENLKKVTVRHVSQIVYSRIYFACLVDIAMDFRLYLKKKTDHFERVSFPLKALWH